MQPPSAPQNLALDQIMRIGRSAGVGGALNGPVKYALKYAGICAKYAKIFGKYAGIKMRQICGEKNVRKICNFCKIWPYLDIGQCATPPPRPSLRRSLSAPAAPWGDELWAGAGGRRRRVPPQEAEALGVGADLRATASLPPGPHLWQGGGVPRCGTKWARGRG